MKQYIILLMFSVFSIYASAQQDTSVYQLQRKKINELLNNRSEKFGQYDQSLAQRTGIFGLKTKKDMQQSVNILTEIAKTDNDIFRELKILLDYKDLEKTEAEDRFSESKNRTLSFMTTITKLQQQNEKLQEEHKKSENRNITLIYILISFVLIVLGLGTYLYRTNKLTFS